MKTIWKYQLITVDHQEIELPQGAELLTVQVQADEPCLWALVDPDAPKYLQGVSIYGTGHQLPENPGAYIGTYQVLGGALVFHVFKTA